MKKLKRVAIIDFDVHAGNGTEDLILNGIPDGEVLMFSSHQDPVSFYPYECFPQDIGEGKQKGKIANIALMGGSGDVSYQKSVKQIIKPMLQQFKPEFILFSAGFDAHHTDPLGGLGFTDQGYGNIIQSFSSIADEYANGRMLATLEGGYNIKAIARSITNVISSMSTNKNIYTSDQFIENERITEYTETDVIPQLQEYLEPYWKF